MTRLQKIEYAIQDITSDIEEVDKNTVRICIMYGDWKHSHLRADYLISQLGGNLVDVSPIADDDLSGNDCYHAYRTYSFKPLKDLSRKQLKYVLDNRLDDIVTACRYDQIKNKHWIKSNVTKVTKRPKQIFFANDSSFRLDNHTFIVGPGSMPITGEFVNCMKDLYQTLITEKQTA